MPSPSRHPLIEALHACAVEAAGGHMPVSRLTARLGASSFGLLGVIHTLPFLQPFSLGPVSTAMGFSLIALGWQLVRGRAEPWLPQRLRDMTLSGRLWGILLRTCERVLACGSRLSRRRLTGLATGPAGRRLIGAILAAGGLLLAVPLAGVPFSNTLPALAVLLACLGELEEDGALVIAGLCMLAATCAYFAFLGWLFWTLGDGAWEWIRARL